MNNYWDVGQFFSVSMLANDVAKAVQAAEKLFKLKPPVWYVVEGCSSSTQYGERHKLKTSCSHLDNLAGFFHLGLFVTLTLYSFILGRKGEGKKLSCPSLLGLYPIEVHLL